MDRQSIAVCHSMKGLSTKALYQDLRQTLAPKAAAYRLATWSLHGEISGPKEREP
jgi:hypothetical protein